MADAGVEAFRLEAQVLAGHVVGEDRSWVLAHPEHDFNELAGESLLQRREAGEPLAYITGWREFYGRRFTVTPAVLIPRHETEVLVETALSLMPLGMPSKVLDIGTGSGCIAITLKLERPEWIVSALDFSEEALEVARRNGAEMGADVDFIQSDLFASLDGSSFDLLVSNPPYIGCAEVLAKEVHEFEPHAALYSGETGLEFYERLAEGSSSLLADEAHLAIEVGYSQADLVQNLFEMHGWVLSERVKDLSGIDRVLVLQRP